MGLISLLFDIVSDGPKRPNAKRLRNAETKPRKVTRNGRTYVRVRRDLRPVYQERGWKEHKGFLVGFYRTRNGAFKGVIEKPFSKNPTYYIETPPERLLNGEHSACFTETSKNTFRIHWSKKPADVNVGILRMETTIVEAMS